MNCDSVKHRLGVSEISPVFEMHARLQLVIYGFGFMDLGQQPVILTSPDSRGRYYMIEICDMWSNAFAYPAGKVADYNGGKFAVVGPGWNRSLPAGVQPIDCPTRWVSQLFPRQARRAQCCWFSLSIIKGRHQIVGEPLAEIGPFGFGKFASLRFSNGVQRTRKRCGKRTKSVGIVGGKRHFVSSSLSNREAELPVKTHMIFG